MMKTMAESSTKENVVFDTEFIKFYSNLPKKPNLFRLFNQNTYYTLHDDNAEHVCKNFLNTTESLKEIKAKNADGKTIKFTCISQARYLSLIRYLLVENNYFVEIYSKENPKSFTNKNWKLESEASPGCLGPFETILYEDDVKISIQSSSVYVTDDHIVNVASIDPVGCIIFLGTFQDNDCYRQLESVLVISNPKECLVPENQKILSQMLRKNQILERKYSTDDVHIDEEVGDVLRYLSLPQSKDVVEDILKKSGSQILIPLKALLAKQKLLISRMKTEETKHPFGCFFIKQINPNKCVRLDLSSIKHLHLFPPKHDSKAKNSLFQILNHCQTVCGTKLLEKFLRQPSLDKNTIENRLDIVEYFKQNNEFAMKIREKILPQVPDIAKLYKKLTTVHYSIKDLFNLYILMEQLRHLKQLFDQESAKLFPKAMHQMLIVKLLKTIADTNSIYVKLAKALDLEQFEQTRELLLNVKMFPKLAELDRFKQEMLNKLKQERKMIQSKYQITISLEQNKETGWFYRTEKKNQSKIPKTMTYQVIASEREFKFSTKLSKNITDEYNEWQKQFEKISQGCIGALLDDFRSELSKIAMLESYISFLDVVLSFAKFASDSSFPLCRPTILPRGSNRIELIDLRHPILAMLKNESFVPNDVRLDDRCKFYVITGPNMGGKSTLLRSVALCVLMAQIGSYVPCSAAIISLVDAIYTRISSADNQTLGMSTFMTEMCEMAGILKSSTSDSLILIDELGRSTATDHGFGLAQSATEHISQQLQSYALFATHFHNLGVRLPKVERLEMQASFSDDNQLIIHYTARQAKTGNTIDSFGIEMMKSVGMPEHLIKDAEERLQRINHHIDDQTVDRALDLLNTTPAVVDSEEKFIENLYEILSK